MSTPADSAAPRLADAIWHGVDSDGDHVAVSPDGRLWWWNTARHPEWAAYPEEHGVPALALIAWAMAERARAHRLDQQVTQLMEEIVALRGANRSERARAEDAEQALRDVLAVCRDRAAFVMLGPRAFARAEQIALAALAKVQP